MSTHTIFKRVEEGCCVRVYKRASWKGWTIGIVENIEVHVSVIRCRGENSIEYEKWLLHDTGWDLL